MGLYENELDAALAFDQASMELNGPTNFHYEGYSDAKAGARAKAASAPLRSPAV